MAIQGVDTKCYILALFVRDDGERFLLGSGHYEFKDTQMHFAANAIQNDIVEVQGNDGFLLAGQVRRPGTQSFDGYVGDGTMSKEETESYRRQFFSFFRKNFFYKVIYVFSDGTAIQRKRGFLVDDPTVQELYQIYPEYHVALNFEDVNYYSYSEDDEGHEQYAKEATIDLSSMRATGGLEWDNLGVIWENPWSGEQTASGTEITIQNDMSVMSPTKDTMLYGDTFQNGTPTPDAPVVVQTVTGEQTVTVTRKNLFNINARAGSNSAAQTSTIGKSLTVTAVAASTAMHAIVIENSDDLLGKECTLSIGEASTSAESATTGRVAIYNGLLSNPTSVSGNIAYSTSIVSGSTLTFTFPNSYASGKDCFCILFYASSASSANTQIGDTSTYGNIQLEIGSTATTYEPYQSQSYEINLIGKNLFDKDNLSDGWLDINDNINPDSSWKHTDYIPITPSTPYTTSGFANGSGTNPARCYYDANKVFISGAKHNSAAQFVNTSPSNARYMRECCKTTDIDTLQIEAGSSASSYAPYYNYELCKIGEYQDYIYKSGDDWFVHKEVQHLSLGISDMDNNEQYPGWRNRTVLVDTLGSGLNNSLNRITQYLANILTSDSSSTDTGNLAANTRGTGSLFFQNGNWNQTYWKTNYPNLSLELYYGILVPQADTQITDQTLVAQLNALGRMRLFVGENNLTVLATDTNLPSPISFKYYTIAAITGAVWEEGGSGGATVVEVDSITNIYPIWKVKGPAVNPELSVISTNTTIQYNGTITGTQTLEVDMFNKTAKLNGVSVIGNISGDWINFSPGTNRVIYTADNADALPSTIEWQEVVG